MTTRIEIQNLRLWAFHGVLPQERTVGNAYRLDLSIEADVSRAMESDDLNDTVNYALVVNAVKAEMQQPSALLEHVAGRILRRLHRDFPAVGSVDLRIAKLTPPLGDEVEACAFHLIE